MGTKRRGGKEEGGVRQVAIGDALVVLKDMWLQEMKRRAIVERSHGNGIWTVQHES